GILRVVDDRPAVKRSAPRGFDGLPLERAARGAGRAGRMAQSAAVAALLDLESALTDGVEPELVVLGDGEPGDGGHRVSLSVFGLNRSIRKRSSATTSPFWSS